MRYCLFLFLLFGQLTVVNAQLDQPAPTIPTLKVGYSLGLSYNMYSWHRPPSSLSLQKPYSTGQVLNILPGFHTGLWIGNVKNWLLSVETGINFLPFALSSQQYSGLGILEVPTLIRVQFPLTRQQSLWTFLHLGAGLQWQSVDLYDRASINSHQRQYFVWVGEIGWQLAAVAHQQHRIRALEFFVRVGAAPVGATHISIGLCLRFRNGKK
ncbi:MAG: hypothetical protein ACRBFS_09680 [Aureispira sp.]